MCPLTPLFKNRFIMCTCPNFVYLTKIDDKPLPKCKKIKTISYDEDGNKIENFKILDDGYYSRFHYSFLPHASYDRVMKDDPSAIDRLLPVNCGKCLECRIQYARSWADRCALEAKKYKFNYFITLTYDDNHVPEYGSLRPRDMTLFIKRVRKKYGKNIKYLYSGEYGTTSLRPHYHIIFFNLPIEDLSFDFTSYESGKPKKHSFSHSNSLMYSSSIHKLWYDEDDRSILGNISIAQFTYDTAAYVSQYVTKKCGREDELKDFYQSNNLVPEFLRMSKGISADSYSDIYFDEHDNIIIPGDGHVASLPRYFTKLYYKTNDALSPKKLARQTRLHNIRIIDYLHFRNFDRQAEIRDYNLKAKQKLKRVL